MPRQPGPSAPARHLFTGGPQCGSPALRGEELCFYHHSTRRPLKTQLLHGRATAAALPEPLDLHLDRTPVTDYTNHPSSAPSPPLPKPPPRPPLTRVPQDSNLRPGSQTEPQTVAPEVQTAQTEVQTQPQQNEDFETSQEKLVETPEFPIQRLRRDSPEAAEPQASSPPHRRRPLPRRPPDSD